MSDRIITMDLETRDIDGWALPYCISIYDGVNIKSFYLLDFNDNIEKMLEVSIKYLMREKYNKYKVYLHNFSYFDSIFLINTLSNLSNKIKPIIRDGRIIDFKFSYSKNYYINFRDSYLLMPTKLSKLATTFNFENKGIFPYRFLDLFDYIKLDYIGKFPRFKFFDINSENINLYINYKNQFNKL